MKEDARVKAVVSNHMKASLRKAALVLQHVVEVLTGDATDQHQSIEQSTIRGARGKRALATYHTNHGWIGDSQGVGKGDTEYFVHSPRHVPN